LSKFGSQALIDLQADAIYFLMSGSWKGELRSNRWHFAKQWSRYLPVTMLQPELDAGKPARSEVVDGIANCRLLYIRTGWWCPDTWVDADQIEQIHSDMRARNFRRPILWLYNPNLVGAFASIPAVARVVHATESYFDWANIDLTFLNRLRLSGEIADVIIPVSEGVQACYQKNLPHARYQLLTNGCDYQAYSSGKPDQLVSALKSRFKRVAIYAGNINERLDYRLIFDCARRLEQTCLTFFGPVSFLRHEDAALWSNVTELPNVRYMGPVEADRIPGFYAAADVGIIPYKDTVYIRESGFALKALEMIAAGLPVVSTMMRPLAGVSKQLHITEGTDEFLAALVKVDRRNLSPREQQEMRDVSRRYDYESRFPLVLIAIRDAVGRAPKLRVGFREFARTLSSDKLGVVADVEPDSTSFAGDVPSYLQNVIDALRVDGSVREVLVRKIRSSSMASMLHQCLRSSPAAAAILRRVRDAFLRSKSQAE
jgi:glycosyltransferase involved in cell wall biosynthesis